MEHILNKIKEYNRIIIHGHKRPDGDCLGSQFGLKDIIKTSFPNKEVYVVGESSEFVDFIGQVDTVSDEMFKGALSIIVDNAVSSRTSDTRFMLADYAIKIDHHIPVEDYGDYQYVDTTSPSCAQIITEFYMKFSELKLTKVGGTALMTGQITDTGRFRYDSVDGRTLRSAAALCDLGVSISKIDQKLSSDTLADYQLKGYVLSNFKTTPDGFIYVLMTRDVIEKFGVSDEDAASQVNVIGTLEGFPVWALIIEYPGNEIRVRLRSRGPVINTLAAEYNGGGHAKAAGCELENWDALEGFAAKCNDLSKEWNLNNK